MAPPPPLQAPSVKRSLEIDYPSAAMSRKRPSPPPVPSATSPSRTSLPACAASEAAPAASPLISRSQYLPAQDKVGGWLCDLAASNVRYPTPPAAPDKEGLSEYYRRFRVTANYFKRPTPKPWPITIRNDNGERKDRKDFRDARGRTPICYLETGRHGHGKHDFYMCFDKPQDVVWARRIQPQLDTLE